VDVTTVDFVVDEAAVLGGAVEVAPFAVVDETTEVVAAEVVEDDDPSPEPHAASMTATRASAAHRCTRVDRTARGESSR
jgi:hypothetical protein